MKKITIILYYLLLTCVCLADEDVQYYAVYMNGSKVGHSVHTRIVEDDKVTTSEQSNFTIKRGSFSLNISTTETFYETIDGKPLGFKSKENMGTGVKQVIGKINPDNTMSLEIKSNGNTVTKTLPFPSDSIMAEAARLLTLKKGLKPGTKMQAKIFSPSMLTALDTEVLVGSKQPVDLLGRVVELTRVDSTINALTKIKTTAYLDENAQPLKIVMPILGINIEIIACEKKIALSPVEEFDMMDSSVESPKIIKNIPDIKSISYTITTDGNSVVKFPETHCQSVKQLGNNTYQINVARQEFADSLQEIPYIGEEPEAVSALKSNLYIESDNSEIIALAEKIIGEETNALKAALKIENYVARYIDRKNLSAGYATALEVLRSKQGDCTEHAVLTAALCRAVGIPSKMAIGLVYADNFANRQNIFGLHAWTTVYIDGKWINLDSTRAFDGPGFTPTHITSHLSNGAASDFLDMISSMAAFKINSLEIEY